MSKKSLLDSFVFGSLQEAKLVVDSMKGVNTPPDSSIIPLPVTLQLKESQNLDTKSDYFRTHRHLDTKTPEHLDTKTPEHLPEHLPGHLDTKTLKHLDTKTIEHQDNWTPEHLDTKTNGHLNTLKSGHLDNKTLRHLDTKTPEHLDTKTNGHFESTYKTDRQILNNLSVYVESSDYWQGQGLTLKKCEQWIEEMQHCNPDFLLTQLQFGEHTEKVVKSDKPVSYFRSCLMSGGLERPKEFEFPHEKAARIKQLEFETQQKALSEQESIRQKEKELADKKNFFDVLKDKETVDYLITQIESKFTTPTTKFSIKSYRTNGEIDSKLEIALQREFFMSEGK